MHETEDYAWDHLAPPPRTADKALAVTAHNFWTDIDGWSQQRHGDTDLCKDRRCANTVESISARRQVWTSSVNQAGRRKKTDIMQVLRRLSFFNSAGAKHESKVKEP